MLCDSLKSVSTAELVARTRMVERIELETPQVIYIMHCEACKSTHSVEFSSADGEPEFLVSRYTKAG